MGVGRASGRRSRTVLLALLAGDGPFDDTTLQAGEDGRYSASVAPGTCTVGASADSGRSSPVETIRVGNTASRGEYHPPAGVARAPLPSTSYRLRFTTLGGKPIRYEPRLLGPDGAGVEVRGVDVRYPGLAEVRAAPGTYRWGPTLGLSPASDGPWWYRSPDDAVVLPADPSTAIVVPLTIRS